MCPNRRLTAAGPAPAVSVLADIIVPLIVFFALQRYLVRGLLAGSVKGG